MKQINFYNTSIDVLAGQYFQTNDYKVFNQLVEKTKWLVDHFTLKFRLFSYIQKGIIEKEELEQLVLIGLFEGIQKADLTKGTYFLSICYRIQSEFNRFLNDFLFKNEQRYRKSEAIEFVPLSDEENKIADYRIDTEIDYARKALNQILEELAEKDKTYAEALKQFFLGDKTKSRKLAKGLSVKNRWRKILTANYTLIEDYL